MDAGQFQFRLKAPTGTRIEQTEAITQEALRFIGEEVRAGERWTSALGYVGVVPSSYPINTVYLWMGGPEESVMRVALKPGAVRVEELKARLREKLPAHLRGVDRREVEAGGRRRPTRPSGGPADIRLSFEPADIVNEVMSFGSPYADRGQVVSGPKMADNRAYAEKVCAANWRRSRPSADLQYGQALDYPTVEVSVDREKLAAAGGDGGRRGPGRHAVHLVEPVHRPELLARPGAAGSATRCRSRSRHAGELGQGPGARPGRRERRTARCWSATWAGEGRDDARADRPLQHAAGGEHDRRTSRATTSATWPGRWREAIEAAGPPPAGVQVDVRGQVTPLERSCSAGCGVRAGRSRSCVIGAPAPDRVLPVGPAGAGRGRPGPGGPGRRRG